MRRASLPRLQAERRAAAFGRGRSAAPATAGRSGSAIILPRSNPDGRNEISNPSRHRARRLRSLPRHDDLGRAEQRSRRPRAARPTRSRRASTSSIRRRCIRCRRTRRRRAAPRRILGSWLAGAPARRSGHRDQGGRARAARLDPRRPHRSHARRDRRSRRHEPRATAHRLHRPLPDPLAAAKRADVRRDGVRSGQGARRAADPRAGRRHGRDDQGGQDPPLRPVERDGLGRRASSAASRGSSASRAR